MIIAKNKVLGCNKKIVVYWGGGRSFGGGTFPGGEGNEQIIG